MPHRDLSFPMFQAVLTFEAALRPGAHVRVYAPFRGATLTAPAFVERVARRRITVRLAETCPWDAHTRIMAGFRLVVPTVDGRGWRLDRRVAPL
jgi:hypothetical protein